MMSHEKSSQALLGRIACTQCIDVAYRLLLQMKPSVVCVSMHDVSVCLLITTVSCAETAEPIEMLFEVWTRGDPRNRVCIK